MRWTARIALVASVALVAHHGGATDRQLALDVHAGFSGSSGPLNGLGLSVDLGVGYGLNDAFSLYGIAGYALGIPGGTAGLRHDGALAAGIRYAFDYIRVVPYVGVALRADVIDAGGTTWATPGAEVRGGVYYLLNRTTIVDIQGMFAEPFLSMNRSAEFFTVSVGIGYLMDL